MNIDLVQDIIAHMASSSSGFYKGQEYHLDQVRIGSALYGSEGNTSAFRWLTRITGIKQVTLLLHVENWISNSNKQTGTISVRLACRSH